MGTENCMKITANRIFAYTPPFISMYRQTSDPPDAFNVLFICFLNIPPIYIHCVHLSFPTQLEHAFLFSSSFFCFNVSAAAAAERSLLMYFVFLLFGTGIPQQETPSIALYYIPDVINFVSV